MGFVRSVEDIFCREETRERKGNEDVTEDVGYADKLIN